jgi:MFS family permease
MWGMLWGVARYGLVLAFPTVPVIVFGSSLLRGFFMGFRIVGLTVFVAQHAPKFQASTALALFTVTLANLSNLVGGPLAGVVFDTVGGYWIYVLAAVGLAITTLVLATMPIGNWRHALYAGRHALEIEQ